MLIVVLLMYTARLLDASSNCSDSLFPPVDWPGSSLSVSSEQLSKSLTCIGDLTATTPNEAGPILLVPGTGVETAAVQYSVGWMIELSKLNWPYCLLDPPDYGFGDIQRSGEYVVYAIRTMYERGNRRRINIIGHSQGGMSPRWALRFWPDVRSMVNNMIGLAPANHGVEIPQSDCTQGCVPVIWQFLTNSRFMCALNSFQETFDNQIAYTQIMSRYDETIQPIQASELSGGVNIYVQDLCANNRVNHVGLGVHDQLAFLITMDALTHNGTASLPRIQQRSCFNASCCNRLNMASFNQTLFEAFLQIFSSNQFVLEYPTVIEEPPLKCYATRDCALKSESSITFVSMEQLHFILLAALGLVVRTALS